MQVAVQRGGSSMKTNFVFALVAVLLCSGCISLRIDDAQLTEIHKRGLASLQPSSQDQKASLLGPHVRRFYVVSVDMPAGQKGGGNRVYELTPGVRHVVIAAYIQDSRFGGHDLKTADTSVSFEARAGVSYRVDGRISTDSVDFWIMEVETGNRVTDVVTVPLKLKEH